MIQNSEHDNPLNEPSVHNQPTQSEDGERQKPIISLFNPHMSQDLRKQDKLNTFYVSLNSECLGFAEEPIDKNPIGNKKINLGKRYHKQTQGITIPQENLEHDGIFTVGETEKADTLNLYRLERRLVRDCRQEFYSQNGELNLAKSSLDQKVSRLINISFQNNPSLAVYQKNAILSMRNNQSKSDPFEFEIIVGKISIVKHPLKIEQQKKFQQIRPYLNWLQKYLQYPTLPHLSNIKRALQQKHMQLVNQGAKTQIIKQAKQKLQDIKDQSRQQSMKVQDNMKTILRIWDEIKGIRRTTHMTIVPWKLQVKDYNFEGRDQYQIGVSSTPLTQQNDVHQNEKDRRLQIRNEQYYVKVIINGNQVMRSSKQNLQWPSFVVTFNEKLKINLYTKPSSAIFQIMKVGFIDKVIDKITIKLPGQHANTLTSSERLLIWQQFALNGDQVRKKSQESIQPAGFLSYRTEWKGTGSKMPPSRAVFADEDQQATTGDQEQVSEMSDPNDPRRIAGKHKNKVKIMDRDMIYQQSTLPFAGIISTRQLLLKLRQKSQLQNIVIPLTQEGIRKRPDLLDLIKRQKELAVLQQQQQKLHKIYNPVDGIFKQQSKETKERIKMVLRKIPMNRYATSGFVNTSKYKLVDEVINEYTFDQMVSPIVVFFKDLFTQQRKLGPKKQNKPNPRSNISQFSFALQTNSGWNIPMRDNSGNLIVRYRQIREEIMQQFLVQQVGIFSGGFLFQQQPNFGANAMQYYNNNTGQMQFGVRGYDGPVVPGQGMNQFMGNINVNYNQLASQGNAQQMLSNIQRVKPFIQFNFGVFMKRTREVQGTSPEWNEELDIKFDCKRQKISLQQIPYKTGRFLTITLFDMYQESQPTNTISELKVKKTKYYLGNIQIPISTVICTPKISGFFRLNRPILLLGYNTMPQTILGNNNSESQFKSENPLIPSHLSLNLTVNPLIDSSFAYANDRKFLIGFEKTQFLQFASDWLDQLNIKRYIRLWMNNADGQSIFISRLICEIDPPALRSSDEPEKWIEKTARFVSLIPYKSTCKLLDNTQEFHLTLRQFLDTKMGDDHAFLLCSCFNAIDRIQGRHDLQSLVVVGKAFPEGKTTYVMRRNKVTKQFQLWNPRTGDCYYLKEQATKHVCPLHEVGCLVSVENVYVNIQTKSHPFQISFDIENNSCWKPFLNQEKLVQFFNSKVPEPYFSTPITEQAYEQKHGKSQQIQLSIFQYIKNMMQTDRKKLLRPHTFRINMDLSNYIRNKLLMELQIIKSQYRLTGIQSPLYSERQKSDWNRVWENIEEIKSSIKNKVDTDRRIYGFPINISFTTLDDIWAQISQSHVHLNEREDMEFVLAVRCFEYPCFLTSVWVFVGSIQ